MALPPALLPPILRRSALNERTAAQLDALLIISAPAHTEFTKRLPGAAAWVRLRPRTELQADALHSRSLPNTTQTLAVLACARAGASAFERLNLGGRMLRELAARKPGRIGIVVDASLPAAAGWYEAVLAAALAQSFALPQWRSKAARPWHLQAIELFEAPPLPLARIQAGARAGNLVRWLTALPPNHLDARAYRALLRTLARRHGLGLRWYSERELKRMGAGAFLAVTRGNATHDAGIARLIWHGPRTRGKTGRRARPDVALVGKGIVFDTGGINLKSHRSMLDMHTDMAGSALALATLLALAELRAPLHAECWLAISENNIGPRAYRPQEVVRALNGTTIQVIHSDAEGRMVLADTLALASRSQPALMLDYGTLTGACIHALTERYSGVFANRPELAARMQEAGAASGERVWNFPLDTDFDSDLESSVADIAQCAVEGKGDHILAARFLSRFVADGIPWGHVDLSAATRRGGLGHVNTEITGFGARFTLQLLLGEAGTGGPA